MSWKKELVITTILTIAVGVWVAYNRLDAQLGLPDLTEVQGEGGEAHPVLLKKMLRLKNLPVQPPVPGMAISSGYGWRAEPITDAEGFHEGIDIALRAGSEVYASGGGIIDTVAFSPTYGWYLTIRHVGTPYRSRLAHLSRFAPTLRPGLRVRRGQLVGYSGASGRVTGPHLHFEILSAHGASVNPALVYEEYAQLRGELLGSVSR